MAGSYIPIITTYVGGVVEIKSTDNTPYEEIQNSMGSVMYGIKNMYLNAQSNEQVLEPLGYRKYDVNGTVERFQDTPYINPYQYQKSLFMTLVKDNVVLDGRTNISFTILPNEIVRMTIYVEELSGSQMLSPTKFFDDLFFNQDNGLFYGFKDTIET